MQSGSFLFETEPVTVPSAMLLLEANRPNPFNPSTRIGYLLPRACAVKLDVFDAAG